MTTRRGFTGHEHLDNLSLIHMNGRVYDPKIGRFLSGDPVIGDLGSPQSLNPYSYVGNNPLSATDPTGFYSMQDAFTASTVDLIANGALLDLDVSIANYQRSFSEWRSGCLAALALCDGASVPKPTAVTAAGIAAVRASTAVMHMINDDLASREQQREAGLNLWYEQADSRTEAVREASQSREFWAFVSDSSVGYSGDITIVRQGGLDPAAARELYGQTLANLRANGQIPDRSRLSHVFGDNFSFRAGYGVLVSEQRSAAYSTWDEAARSRYTTVAGATRRSGVLSHSTIYLGAAHPSIIPALGSGVVPPSITMQWINLHEYGHQLYGTEAEDAAHNFAVRNFQY